MRDQIDAGRRRLRGCRIEQAEIAGPGAAADFVIAAQHDPWRRQQGRRGRGEEIGLPGRPIVAVGAARATRISGRARALAVEILSAVASTNQQRQQHTEHRADRRPDHGFRFDVHAMRRCERRRGLSLYPQNIS
jgi:hypothetical protein